VKKLKPFYEIDIPNQPQNNESDTHIDDDLDTGISPTDENQEESGVDNTDNNGVYGIGVEEALNKMQSETPPSEVKKDAFGRIIEDLKPSNIVSPTKPVAPKPIPKILQDDNDDDNKEVIDFPVQRMSDSYHTQQFWAEMYHYYLAGEQWWPDAELESYSTVVNKSHDRVDPTIEVLEDKFDLDKNDEWRKEHGIRGEHGITTIGEAVKFVTLNTKDICIELGLNHSDARITNVVSNYLRSKGIARKVYNVHGKRKKAMRIALNWGETMSSDFMMPIHTTEGESD